MSFNQVSRCAFLIVFLSLFSEGTSSSVIWSQSRLANAYAAAFSRTAQLGKGRNGWDGVLLFLGVPPTHSSQPLIRDKEQAAVCAEDLVV